MAEIIAQTYELMNKIGAGGGGTVYLARHLRLNKMVVLKADKRRLSTRPELLRREVDVLKDLSHTYIPQVYDFFAIDDTVYTVMDYVQGESLDRPLKRGERFPQPLVIKWARELLEALDYLHSPTHGDPPRGFVHSDIKPANIMLKPNGDICLIDFNIALALGEEAVIGGSAGYASPEHYGLDYSFSSTQSFTAPYDPNDDRTITIASLNAARTTGRRIIVPDVRSDIYSVGATLYHLISGRRPARNAIEVIPLSAAEASQQVVDIITRSMNPNPDLRYQTAAEMLAALDSLHENDVRTVRHKKRVKVGGIIFAALFLVGGATSFLGLRMMQREESRARLEAQRAEEEARQAEEAAKQAEEQERIRREAEEAARSALAAVTQSEDAYRAGDVAAAKAKALEALGYDSPYAARSQLALTEALGVYDLSEGFRPHGLYPLGAEPKKLAISPNGSRFAAMADGKLTVYDTETGASLAELDTDLSALSDAVFYGEDVIIYAGDGALRAYDIAGGAALWEAGPATNIAINGNTVATVYRSETTAYVFNADSGTLLHTVRLPGPLQRVPENDIFTDPGNDLFALNEDGTKLAVSVLGGGLRIVDLNDEAMNADIYQSSDFTHFEGGFFGKYLAFAASGGGQSVFAVIDTEEYRQTGGFSSTSPFHVQADGTGVYLSLEDVLVKIDPESGEQTEVAYTEGEITGFCVSDGYAIVATDDGLCSVFAPGAVQTASWNGGGEFVLISGGCALSAGSGDLNARVMTLEDHSDAILLRYDPEYRHNEARLSADGSTVMFFRYDSFRIYSSGGEIIADVSLPDASKIYDQQYRRDENGSRLEVTWYDGTVRSYSAADGSLIDETSIEPPDTSLYVEYFTEKYRISAPLEGTPEVYDRETGEKLGDLQSEDFLTYVYDCAGMFIAEYMDADGGRYGLLLNDELETVARIPNLCDVFEDGRLIFDDMRGILRQSRIYSIQELTALAN